MKDKYYYKLIINQYLISKTELITNIKKISDIFIIITPSSYFNYYIIYLIIRSLKDIKNIILNDFIIKNIVIKSINYNKIIYKIIYKYLLNYNNYYNYYDSNKYILLDNIFINVNNINLYHNLSLYTYMNLFTLNKKLYINLHNFFKHYNNKFFWIYNHNHKYIIFIKNLLLFYKKSKIFIIHITNRNKKNISQSIKDYIFSNYIDINNIKYIIIFNIYNLISSESLSLFIKEASKCNKKINIIILSTKKINNNMNIYLNYCTFHYLLHKNKDFNAIDWKLN